MTIEKNRDEAIKKAELLFQALDADGDGSLTQVGLVSTQLNSYYEVDIDHNFQNN